MTFQQLSYLLEVDRTRSFSQAAKALFVSQSTVSNAVAALESELNCRIFVRSVQGLAVTTEGQQVLTCARRICENHAILTSAAKSNQLCFRVTSPEYPPARNAFLRILEEYRDHPELEFSFGVAGSADFYDRLLLQQADVSVSISFSHYDQHFMNLASAKKLSCQKLVALPMGICIGEGHPLYCKKDLVPADLAGERFLDSPSKTFINTGALLVYVPINKENALLCDNAQLKFDILRKGLAYTVMRIPSKSAREEGLRYIPIPGLTMTVAVYTDPIRPVTPLVSRYLELLQEEIRKEL